MNKKFAASILFLAAFGMLPALSALAADFSATVDGTLAGTAVAGNTFDTSIPNVPFDVGIGGTMLRKGDDIYVLQGGSFGDTDRHNGFQKYSISNNSWTKLADAPGQVSIGSNLISNGSDNEIYFLQGRIEVNDDTVQVTGFFKYSVSADTWTPLAKLPAPLEYGATMIRNGSDNDIFVLQGNQHTGFFKYSISADTWTPLAAVPGPVYVGATMIRKGSDNEIYVLQGQEINFGGAGNVFLKYSISANAWTPLASLPGNVGNGASMIRNGGDNNIYVMQGGLRDGFFRYSITGNSWTPLASPPSAALLGPPMIRNGSDNDIYFLPGAENTDFFRYSISGNSWTTLADVPSDVGYGSKMLRNGADNSIFILAGGPHLWRYAINAETTATGELLYNGDMSIEGSTDVLAGIDAKARPDGWFPSGYGDNTRYYIYGGWSRPLAPDERMVKVKVSRYKNGNASWLSQDIPVTGGQTYVLTHDYRSDVPSTLGLRYKINGVYTFQWLNTFPATNTYLQVPVRRRFTVPEGATHLALYAAISSVGYLEVGNFSLVDATEIDRPDPDNLIRNGSLLEVDKNNEPVGWHHISSTGEYRGYKWQPCSIDKGIPPELGSPRPCPVFTTNFISLGSPEGAFMKEDASWYTDEVLLPPASGTALRNLALHTYFVAPADFNPRIRYTLSDGSKVMVNDDRNFRTDPDSWGGRGDVTTEKVPADAVSFSLFLTRYSGQDTPLSKFADIKVRIVDPGALLP